MTRHQPWKSRGSGTWVLAASLALACSRQPTPSSETPAAQSGAAAPAVQLAGPSAALQQPVATPAAPSARKYSKPSDEELRARLSPMAYRVTQEEGTEPPFQNEYWNNHEEGIYVDTVTGEPLFSSKDKYDSGTGWPSFTRPIDSSRVVNHTDQSLGMSRTEVRSKDGNSHLGHVFDDGPEDRGGQRFCINSASLRFVPVKDLAAQGYADYLPLFQKAP